MLTYTLVSGPGALDNSLFTIDGNELKTAAVLSRQTRSSYSIRVRVTDGGGLFSERVFRIRLHKGR